MMSYHNKLIRLRVGTSRGHRLLEAIHRGGHRGSGNQQASSKVNWNYSLMEVTLIQAYTHKFPHKTWPSSSNHIIHHLSNKEWQTKDEELRATTICRMHKLPVNKRRLITVTFTNNLNSSNNNSHNTNNNNMQRVYSNLPLWSRKFTRINKWVTSLKTRSKLLLISRTRSLGRKLCRHIWLRLGLRCHILGVRRPWFWIWMRPSFTAVSNHLKNQILYCLLKSRETFARCLYWSDQEQNSSYRGSLSFTSSSSTQPAWASTRILWSTSSTASQRRSSIIDFSENTVLTSRAFSSRTCHSLVGHWKTRSS